MLKNTDKGSICFDLVISLACLTISFLLIYQTASLRNNLEELDEVPIYINDFWEDKQRCDIYCPKEDPMVDITF